jgi:hypothetical protein
VRGEFNTFIGCSTGTINAGRYYNIFPKEYNFNNWEDYFLLRYNDSSPFLPISDRIS